MKLKRTRAQLYKRRYIWLDEVFGNLDLQPTAKVAAYELKRRFTMDTTVAEYIASGKIIIWAAQTEVSAKTGINPKTVGKCLAELCEHKHLRLLKRGRWNAHASKYRVLFR